MKRLPPYGRSIDQSSNTITIWAGHKRRVYEMVKAWGPNTLAFFTWSDPQEYLWPVKGRNVLIVHFMAPGDEWIDRIAVSLHRSKADQVVAVQWRPNGHVIEEENLTFTHYQ